MKLVLTFLSTVTTVAWANCNPNTVLHDKSCDVHEGACFQAAENFFRGAGKSATNLLKYGRFCGGAKKCPGLNNAADSSTSTIDVAPCNDQGEDNILDTTCKQHDACLDNSGLPGSEAVPVPERCPCDLAFLANLAGVASGLLGGPTKELCDDEFYKQPAVPTPDLLITYAEFLLMTGSQSAEAVLFAAPFCTNFATNGTCANETLAVYDDYDQVLPQPDLIVIEELCNAIIDALGSVGNP